MEKITTDISTFENLRKGGYTYILYMKDVMEKDGIVHLPLYMAPFLCEKG